MWYTPPMTNNTIPISWAEFYTVQQRLIQQIKDSGKTYKYIITIPCGGLMPAYILAKAFDLPIVTINITSYNGQESGELQHVSIEGFGSEVLNPTDALIVDDIYDSGKTLQYLQAKYPGIDTAVTFARYADNTATYVGAILDHDTWIDFPWEVIACS